jgi:chromosome segregation ATPase
MAENATISNTQHQRATLESIKKFGTENTPLDLRSLTDAITENNESEALKAAENIFSGSPTNIKRFLEIHHQITQGIGHTTHVAAYNNISNAHKEQKKAQRADDFAFLNLLNIQRDTINLINKMIERATNTHAHTAALIETERETNEEIIDLVRQKHEDGEYSTQDLENLKNILAARDEKLAEIEERNNRLLTRYEKLTEQLQEDIHHLPSEGGALVNDLLEQRDHIEELAGAGGVPQAEIDKLNDILTKIDAYTLEHGLHDERDKIKSLFERLQDCTTQLQQLNELMQREKDMSHALKRDIESGNLSPEELKTRTAELLALKEHVTEQDAQVQNALMAHKPALEEGLESLQDLIGKLAEIEKEEQIIVARENVIHENMQKYGNRHEQIAQLHGDGLTEWVRENTILSGMIGETSAWLYAEANELLGIESKTVNAWKNAIEHDGEDVYRDNETGELYTYDAEKGEKTYIKDPSIISALYERAYKNGELFRNETPYSEDPNNTFDQTLENMKQSAEDIKNGINTNATQVIKDKKNDYQNRVNEHEAANDSNSTSTAPDLKAAYDQSAQKIETSDSELGQTFTGAKSARTPSLLNVVDRAIHTPNADTNHDKDLTPLESVKIG